MWVQTSPFTAFIWSLLSVLLYSVLWIFLHSRRKSIRVSDLQDMNPRESLLIGLFLLIWLGAQLTLFSDRDLSSGKSLEYWLGLRVDVRTLISGLTAVTMTSILFAGSLLQAALSEEIQQLFGGLNYTNAAIRAVVTEVLLRMCGVGLLCASHVGGIWTTLIGILWSCLCPLHLCYFYSRMRRSRHQLLTEQICQILIEEMVAGFICTRLFILTGRIYPCILVHFIIAAMRFPDGLYLHPNHPAHRHRKLVTSAYIFGVVMFFAIHTLLVDATAYDSPFY